MKILYGIARKVAIPVLVQAIIGWILFIVGFALWHSDSAIYEGLNLASENVEDYDGSDAYPDHRASRDWAPYWIVAVAGPVLFINSFVHLFVGRWYTGIFTYFLTGVYIVLAGGVVYRDARILFNEGISELLIAVSFQGFVDDLGGLQAFVQAFLQGVALDIPSPIMDAVTVHLNLTAPVPLSFTFDVSLDDFVTDKDLGLYVLIEWVGCTWSLLMMTIYMVMWPLFPNTTTDTIE